MGSLRGDRGHRARPRGGLGPRLPLHHKATGTDVFVEVVGFWKRASLERLPVSCPASARTLRARDLRPAEGRRGRLERTARAGPPVQGDSQRPRAREMLDRMLPASGGLPLARAEGGGTNLARLLGLPPEIFPEKGRKTFSDPRSTRRVSECQSTKKDSGGTSSPSKDRPRQGTCGARAIKFGAFATFVCLWKDILMRRELRGTFFSCGGPFEFAGRPPGAPLPFLCGRTLGLRYARGRAQEALGGIVNQTRNLAIGALAPILRPGGSSLEGGDLVSLVRAAVPLRGDPELAGTSGDAPRSRGPARRRGGRPGRPLPGSTCPTSCAWRILA